MNAIANIPTPMDRVASWFKRPASAPRDLDLPAQQRALFDRIGEFLFANALELTARNFDFARRFLEGGDVALTRAIDAAIERNGRVSDRDIARLVERRTRSKESETLAKLARELEGKVTECLAAVTDSAASTQAYSTALDQAADEMASDPGGTYRRLLQVTLEVAETTRRIGDQLEVTQRDTHRLRDDLDKARRAADEDHLTGLPNRRAFHARVDEAVAERSGRPLAVALCDIDDFKLVNDSHGHDTGDRVLRFVAKLLREALPRQVYVARYGGEEFVCLFDGIAVAQAVEMLDEARTRLRGRVLRDQVSGRPIQTVTFTAGVAGIVDDANAALRTADEALYAAKEAGKDRVTTS